MPNTAVANVSVETLITVVITDTLMQRVRRVNKLREPGVESDTIRSVTTVTCTACATRSKRSMNSEIDYVVSGSSKRATAPVAPLSRFDNER
jgi:hypothetical protein